jgi:hypothetical protein
MVKDPHSFYADPIQHFILGFYVNDGKFLQVNLSCVFLCLFYILNYFKKQRFCEKKELKCQYRYFQKLFSRNVLKIEVQF